MNLKPNSEIEMRERYPKAEEYIMGGTIAALENKANTKTKQTKPEMAS